MCREESQQMKSYRVPVGGGAIPDLSESAAAADGSSGSAPDQIPPPTGQSQLGFLPDGGRSSLDKRAGRPFCPFNTATAASAAPPASGRQKEAGETTRSQKSGRRLEEEGPFRRGDRQRLPFFIKMSLGYYGADSLLQLPSSGSRAILRCSRTAPPQCETPPSAAASERKTAFGRKKGASLSSCAYVISILSEARSPASHSAARQNKRSDKLTMRRCCVAAAACFQTPG